jgi:hypothetical protein
MFKLFPWVNNYVKIGSISKKEVNMKNIFSLKLFLRLLPIIVIFLCSDIIYSQNPRLMDAKDCAVMVTATAILDPPSITLKWKKNDVVKSYEIRKKMKDDNSWTDTIVTFDSLTNTYTDNDVLLGKAYEYKITATEYVSIIKDTGNGNFYYPITAYGYGYIYAGVGYEPPADSSRIILLIDETIKSALPNEIDTLESDLVSEGWDFVERIVPRTEKFDSKAVRNIKNIILEEYKKDTKNTNTVFLLGRVAVPYSGDFNYKFLGNLYNATDAHSDHCGAWPADVYYGSIVDNDAKWTDLTVLDTNGNRKENWNIPDDGKFDCTGLPYSANLAVGRVDLYNMPTFNKSEIELIRNYLKRDHEYRTGQIPIINRGLVDDNFGFFGGEAFSQNAYRNFPPFIGYDSVKEAVWFTELPKSSYLWAYGCGAGYYNSCTDIKTDDSGHSVSGTTSDFAKNSMNVIFTMLFGSYFGDWDSQDNIMRAILCSDPPALTSCWAGRPSWYFHHMALGEPIGYSCLISQNNTSLYRANGYNIGGHFSTNQYALRYVHVALMGDPTLTMNMEVVQPPKNLTVYQSNHKLSISWEKPDQKVDGYIIYASKYSKNGPYHKICGQILTDTKDSFDNTYDGQMYYMVKSVKLQETYSGSYYKMSRGIVKDIYPADVSENVFTQNNLLCTPNPAISFVNIELTIPVQSNTNIEIYNLEAIKINNIISTDLNGGTQQFVWNLSSSNGNRVAPGIYFIKVSTQQKIEIQKIVVLE